MAALSQRRKLVSLAGVGALSYLHTLATEAGEEAN
jgi:hypothetical protein